MTMYLDHFGLREAPFKITPHTEFFFAGANRGETLEALLYAITSGEGIVKVTGEVGAGKTMLSRVLMERLPANVETIYLAVPSLSRDEMLAVIAEDLGIETNGLHTTKIIRALQETLIKLHAEGRQVVALIDEAHAMPMATLEEIRLLSNLETSHSKLMQIVLFGQPELDAHLSLPTMRQLKERITHSFYLLPLPNRDVKDYIDFRLRAAGYKGPTLFDAACIDVISQASEGLTRRINIYADKALLAAFAEGTHTVTANHVRAAVNDTVLKHASQKFKLSNFALISITVALMICAGVGGFMVGRATAPDVPLAAVAPRPSEAMPKVTSPVAELVPPALPAAAVNASINAAINTPISNRDQPATPLPAADKSLNNSQPTATTPSQTAPRSPNLGLLQGLKSEANYLEMRVAADRPRLLKLAQQNSAQIVVQLMTATKAESAALKTYLRQLSAEVADDRIFLTSSGNVSSAAIDNSKTTVLLGGFTDQRGANAQLASLSTQLKQYQPYLRTVGGIQKELPPTQITK